MGKIIKNNNYFVLCIRGGVIMLDKVKMDMELEKRLAILRNNLHYLRKKANKQTYDEVAEFTEISRDSLFKLEKGDERYPNLKTILKLCFYYNVSLDDITTKNLELEESINLAGITYKISTEE